MNKSTESKNESLFMSKDKLYKFGDYLRKARQSSKEKLTMEELSKRLGINKNTLGAYERSERFPDIEFLYDFSEATKTPFINLLRNRLRSSDNEGVRVESSKYEIHHRQRNRVLGNSNELEQKQSKAFDKLLISVIGNYQNEDVDLFDFIAVVNVMLSQLQSENQITDNGAKKIVEGLKMLLNRTESLKDDELEIDELN